MVKSLAWVCVMSAIASASVVEGYRSRFDRSTHMRILSEFFFGATTMGAHQSEL